MSIPFNTKIIIPDYAGGEPVLVRDRGGAIKGDRLDVFFNSREDAMEWGVQDLWVKVEKYKKD